MKRWILFVVAKALRPLGTWLALVLALSSGSSGIAQESPALLAHDGVWCWFGNPRAIFKDGQVYFGYVRYADGRVCLNAYDPESSISTPLWASVMTQRDDHNNPGLLELSDGRMLAIYAKHGGEKQFYFRVTTNAATGAPAVWSPELLYTNTTAGVTYANPYQLSAEGGKVYNFYRNLNFNPTFVTSDDSATNWSAPRILIRTGTGGWRPYVQYCSDFERRIDLTYTDGHPDVQAVPTSLYHLYYAEGALRKTDGTFLKNLADAPLLHDSGERGTVVYQYSAAPSPDPNDHIQHGRAWSWDVAYQSNGAPVTVFSVQVTNVMGGNWYDDRIYYYYARWTGSNWQKRFIAHAGRPLYNTQRHYAGGINLDPTNPNVVYLSSNAADPFNIGNTTTVPLRANDRYEVFRGTTTDDGLTFSWQAVTTNSIVDNLRPYVPRRNPYPVGVIWYAGTYTTYTSWNTAVYGIFATNLVPVTVMPNAAPVVSIASPAATPLILTNLANSLALAADVSDDGQPGSLSLSWSTVSGPTNAIFETDTSAETSVRFPAPGFYVLRLSASDTAATSEAELGVAAGGAASMGLDPDLALWLKLDEPAGSTASDASGSGNHGAVIGSPWWNVMGGKREGALEFNGTNSFLSIADAPELDGTSGLTLAFWMRANSTTAGGAGLVSKRNTLSDNNAFTTFLQVDRKINVDLDGSNNRFTSATLIETGRWYHVTVTFDGSLPAEQRARLYLDGVLDRVATENSAAIPDYNSTLKIGLTHSNVTTYFNGALDDVRLYRRALQPEEIGALAALALAPSVDAGSVPATTNRVPVALSGSATHDLMNGPLATGWAMVSGPAEPNFTDPGAPETTVTFNAAGPYVLRLSASNLAAQVFSDLPVQVNPNPAIYTDWIALAFPGETNPAVLAESADPDQDRIKNFAEFALGMKPGTADPEALPAGNIEPVDSADYLVLRVIRPIGLHGVTYQVRVSDDLNNWTTALQVGPALTNGDGTETLLFRDTLPASNAEHRFIQLVIGTQM